MILNSPYISGSLTVTGNITSQGGITISGSITSASYATTSSFANTASYANTSTSASYALTASFATNFTASNILASNTITAQTLVVQTVTSSIVYSSGSNIFGNQLTDVQQMTGSVKITGSLSLNNIAIPTSASLASTYLPLAGGTLTGALSGTSATFSGIGTFGSSAGAGLRVYGASGTNQWDIYLNSTNLRFSDNTGTGSIIFDRPLSGTSATFTDSTTSLILLNSTNAFGGGIVIQKSGVQIGAVGNIYNYVGINENGLALRSEGKMRLTTNGSTTALIIGTDQIATFSSAINATGDINSLYGMAAARNGSNTQGSGPYFLLSNAASSQLWYQQLNASNGLDYWYNGSVKLTLASTGAATFSSRVDATTFGSTIGNDNFVFDTYGATTGYLSSRIKNSSGSLIMGTEGSVPGNVATGDLAYSSGIYTGTTRALHFGVDQTVAMTIINGSNIGMGTTTPAYRLQLSTDSAAKPSTNTWTISSDIRIKENINPYTKGLETILKINPVTYDYNGKAGFEKIKNNIGIIAQDVLDILPESISTYKVKLDDNDNEESELYNFNSHALTYVLINAIQEQQATITSLQERLTKAGL